MHCEQKKHNITLPAEWASVDFIQLTWPHRNSDWASLIDEVEDCFVRLAEAIVPYASLLIIAPRIDEVRDRLSHLDLDRIRFVALESNDTWARDHGAITRCVNGEMQRCDFAFNGWGMKFAADKDNCITRRLYQLGELGDVPYCNHLGFVLEGGSVESDGVGTLLTTAQCLLSDNRNEHYTRGEVEEYLTDALGFDRYLWIENGYLAGDDTDSHIDTLARFCSEDTIAYVKCDDPSDEHSVALAAMERELMAFKKRNGDPYRLVALPMALPVYDDDGRLPATYANFLIVNGAVIVPTYGTEYDDVAMGQIQIAFPEHSIVGVDCSVLITQHGSLHCVTMQYPK